MAMRRMYKIYEGEDVLLLRDGYVCRYNQPDDYIFTVKFFPGGLEAVLELVSSAGQSNRASINVPAYESKSTVVSMKGK